MKWILAILLVSLAGASDVWAQARGARVNPNSYGFVHRNSAASNRSRPGQPVYPLRQNLPLYNPYFSPNFGPLYEPYDEPCHYDESVGMWIGPCTTGLDTPGFSITVPNRVR